MKTQTIKQAGHRAVERLIPENKIDRAILDGFLCCSIHLLRIDELLNDGKILGTHQQWDDQGYTVLNINFQLSTGITRKTFTLAIYAVHTWDGENETTEIIELVDDAACSLGDYLSTRRRHRDETDGEARDRASRTGEIGGTSEN